MDTKFSRMVLPTPLLNTNRDHNFEKAFSTNDYVFVDSEKNREISPVLCTDYALLCGADHEIRSLSAPHSVNEAAYLWGRANNSAVIDKIEGIKVMPHPYIDNQFTYRRATSRGITTCPALSLSLDFFRNNPQCRLKNNRYGNPLVTVGLQYPNSHVGNDLDRQLKKDRDEGRLVRTGAKYFGFVDSDGTVNYNYEYTYPDTPHGDKYVHTEVNLYDENQQNTLHFGDHAPKNGKYVWTRVLPVIFQILNWEELPCDINPLGSGKATCVKVIASEGLIAGLPFALDTQDPNYGLWQNSPIRAYLNGYDLAQEIDRGNGNRGFKLSHYADCHDFSGRGFWAEASQGMTQDKIAQIFNQVNDDRPNPYGFSYEELDNDDLLKLYVQANTAVFLHGPSGVGKSARVKQIDPTATRITLRPQMNPEEVDGTLDRETGKYIPPLWYTQLCEQCQKEPDRQHVLFIDELTNVKPTVQSLVYSIVLDRAGKDGLWPLPANVTVVAAGNENADNLAAYPLTNALFRRFSHLYYQVDKEKWLDWAIGINKLHKLMPVAPDKTKQARIHPAIIAFIMSQPTDVLNQDLDEEDPHIVTDPRKWKIASDVLYATKNPHALKPAVGEEITAAFIDFVQSINLTVDDVVKGNYDPTAFAQLDVAHRLSTTLGLVTATETELPVVRGFIGRYLGQENLAVFDSLWIRNDPERAAIIAEQTPDQTTSQGVANEREL